MKKRKRIFGIVEAGIFLTIVVGCVHYLGDYYKADFEKIDEFTVEEVVITVMEDNNIVYEPIDAKTGLIFYPGGKVEYTAYEPLMKSLTSKGILCVLVEMPFHLAVFDMNAADGIQNHFPQIENWYIGGHSLGGAMAASYIGENTTEYEGLILLGAYSTADLTESSLEVLSVYGSEDMVLDKEKYDENMINLPDDFEEIVLEGGCHAGFGMYGEQKGDGVPEITNEEQINMTADVIANFIE